jgi:hypothetical protein
MLQSATIRSLTGVMGTPLQRGDRGVEQTIDLLRCLVDDAVKDPGINVQAIQILRDYNVANFGTLDRLQAFYDWISQPANFLYVPDPVGPFGPKETLRPARTLFEVKGGDCDDYTALIASLLGTVGIRTRVVTIAADRNHPNYFSHIYPEAKISPGCLIPMDAARPGAQFGVAPPRFFRRRVWSLTDSDHEDVSNALAGAPARKLSSLNGYAVLGDDPVAEDVSAIGQSVANVIAATKGSPYGSFATPYSPWTSTMGPFAPGSAVPPAGYPGGPAGASVSLAGSNALWIVLGIGAVALALSSSGRRR